MTYKAGKYCVDDTTAIWAFSDIGECECSVTINLTDYGLKPENEDYVYIPYYKIAEYDMSIMNQIISDLVEEIIEEKFIGYKDSCKCLYVKLKSNWKEICNEGDC